MNKSTHRFAIDRSAGDDKFGAERRGSPSAGFGEMRYPSWPEQMVQFVTRYLFVALGVLFFNFTGDITPTWMSLLQLNTVYAAYSVINAVLFWHASRRHICPARYRFAMWIDIVITSISILNDPYAIPPSLLVFIMVVLGNGMRYGMHLFRESLLGCFAAAMLVLSLRYMGDSSSASPGLVFLNLFGGIILLYAYILMGRIELSRAQLEHRSRLDTLTGLMNRRGLLEWAEQLFNQLSRDLDCLVVMIADLDKFKSINDTHGHAVGDDVLRQFSDILHGAIRDGDIAARLGGDEFVLILPGTNIEQAELIAHRIQSQVADCAHQHSLSYSVTIGLGEAPRHGGSLSEVLEQVDRALYHAKATHPGGGIMRACSIEMA